MSSLKFLNLNFGIAESTHPVWDSVGQNMIEIRKATTKVRMLTGTYMVQADKHKFSQYTIDPTCMLSMPQGNRGYLTCPNNLFCSRHYAPIWSASLSSVYTCHDFPTKRDERVIVKEAVGTNPDWIKTETFRKVQIIAFCKISTAFFSFKCPVQANWKHREESVCDSADSYFCLYDQNEHTYTEFCKKHPDFEAPDYECLDRNEWKTSFKCDAIVTAVLPENTDTLLTVIPWFGPYIPELAKIPLIYIDENNQDNIPSVTCVLSKTSHEFIRINDAVKDEEHIFNRMRKLENDNLQATNFIYNSIQVNSVILIVGPTGAGKSANAYHVAFRLKEEHGYTVIPARQSIDVTNYHVPGTKQILIVDDFIGKYAVHEKDVVSWDNNGPLLKMLFIGPTGAGKSANAYHVAFRLKEEHGYTVIPVRQSIDVTNYHVPVSFQIIEDEIKNFKTKSHVGFFALAFLAIKKKIEKNSLTIDNHEHDELLQDLFHESNLLQYPSKKILKSTLAAFKGEYVKESDGCFEFVHDTMQNMLLRCIAKTFIESVIKHSRVEVILNQIRLDCMNEEQNFLAIHINPESEDAYFRRLVSELNKGLHKEVFESAQNIIPQFRVKLLEYIKQYITLEKLTKTHEEMTALHDVSNLGYGDYCSFFIHDKQMINVQDNAGNIPLHLACIKGHLKIVEDLVNNDSFIDFANNEELQPFFYACENGFAKVAEYLLQYLAKGIRVNEKYRRKNKRCVLHVVCANGYTNLVKLLLENNAEVDVKDADGSTPLHLACHKGNTRIVSALLHNNANVDVKDSFGKTSVYTACSENNERVLQLLLEKKAVVNQKTISGMTPLSVSCKNENIALVKLLLQNGAKVNSKKQSVVPLHEACKSGNESIINILIQAKASVNHKTKEDITPLHEACRNGHHNVVKLLLDKKAVVNDKDKHGWTALFFSSAHGFHTIVDLLLKKGANLNMFDEDKENPLTLARKENHRDVIKLLMQSKSNAYHCDIDT
ncbi:unnamed protein product [Mytilus coruscus]|uniref:Novel STAND NTPase 3 domain-containing protein n=1 Tax=Mytilus coruscus TaxID=42192 RepID=A0A6J8A179_MYTCO|nr:unnamed protein product [Mytilus coruscus]